MKDILLLSTITCPTCGIKRELKMTDDACQFFWECPSCKSVIKPNQGDCCVFCSYGDVPCPPIQKKKNCC
ncbi:GDCCVxC domain-containing (seleno)protein [Gracilimonas sediminicola]|uniref:GDCCVxC domain-containing (seleno)protein n=1 Tax=Gracilimonas sediminicola TaxID=2952158 RepID=UPI0025463ADE|nr:GDCCVxC domain-containing (seleno)protein [Gracilimonas sediminicola]